MMTLQEWISAVLVASIVALMTAQLMVPPLCWAEGQGQVTVPALPSTALTIPSIDAKVMATTHQDPGKAVQVTLELTCPSGLSLDTVPVTLNVYGTTMDSFSRSMPEPRLVTKIDVAIPVSADGTGTTSAMLPLLVWAMPVQPAPVVKNTEKKTIVLPRVTTRYQLVLSTPLGGKAAPALLPINGSGKDLMVANIFAAPPEPLQNLVLDIDQANVVTLSAESPVIAAPLQLERFLPSLPAGNSQGNRVTSAVDLPSAMTAVQ